jgi:serine/threonine-protein kinase
MPFVEGESLRDRLTREKQLPLEHAVKYTCEVADALHSAHRRGVVHRDIKPENILLQEGHAIVADFGIARAVSAAGEEHSTGTGGLVIGTPMYMSPEQATGDEEVTGRSDVYSLACVLYEMLTGEPPFSGPTIESVVRQHIAADPKLVTDLRATVPVRLAVAVQRALAKTPADRFATVHSFADALRADGAYRSREPAAASIAVLPFTNMSADPENEFFSEGITEDIINALTKVPELRVASRTSAFAFKGRSQDVRTIGERLMVGKVLEGSVRKAANRLRITAQLINTADGYHVWSDQYDRDLDDVFAIQDEISQAIVSALKIKLSSGASLASQQTHDLDAYDLYVKGRYFWNRRGPGLRKAEEHFTAAVDRDPNYAQAHAALADTYNLLGWYQVVAPADAFPRAKAAALRALEISESVAEAHASLAFALMYYDWAWAEAEHEFKRAIELHPGYATAHHWYAEYLMAMGRIDEAIEEADRALELDPVGLIINVVVAMANYYGRRYDRAIEACRRTVEMDPAFSPVYLWLAPAYLQKGLHDEAIRACEAAAELAPAHAPIERIQGVQGVALALSGRRGDAKRMLGEMEARAQATYVPAFERALVHFGLDNRDVGFEWLQRAYEERSMGLAFLKVDPMLDAVRDDERLRELMERMALT